MKRRKVRKKEREKILQEKRFLIKTVRKGKSLYFDCFNCGEKHQHGLAGLGPFTPTHRVSHCKYNKELLKDYYIYYDD